ncbi:GyrI-like domain-containing protein [uncultured Ramlibacter sp.]|uniref:GyrI-like domain-containing protein n=1 Tax=uncultured Ramlibacter sp. TaxID=260755 RepID=UPI0026166BFF|nr:GyrI-like domain-containing protein [uncultured Ramlibacter sp.]
MIDTPEITSVPAQPIAVIRLTVPCADMPKVMGPGISELMAAVAAQGIAVTGPWFTHHLRRPTDSFDFEIGVPVASSVQPAGRVAPSQWPAMTVARTVLHGNYDGLAGAWGEFGAWVDGQGRQCAADFWEVYSKGPESSSNPADWRTQLNRPLLDRAA